MGLRGSSMLLACAAVLTLARRGAASETDYLPDNVEWNGLSTLTDLARGLELRVDLLEELDWSELPAEATLLLVYPTSELDPADVLRFISNGGRLLIADDFGRADPLLEALGVRHSRSSPPPAQTHYLGSPQLPIARISPLEHELTRGASRIITNHPTAFSSPYPSLATFAADEGQLLVAAKVGKGRFVGLADPSVLINAMLQFPDNLTLASNLLHHLRPGPRLDRFCLLTGHFRVRGAPALAARPLGGAQRFLTDYNGFLAQLNQYAPAAHVLQLLAVVAASLTVILFVLLLPLPREQLAGHWLHPRPRGESALAQLPGGGHSASSDAALSAALLREELEERLTERLHAPSPILTMDPQWVVNKVREQGGQAAAHTCSALLAALRHVLPPPDSTGMSPLVGVRRSELATMYELGRQLLLQLDIDSLPAIPTQAKHHDSDQ